MKPEDFSRQLLGATRSKAKMNEYGVEKEFHINLTKDPATLFTLAIGLLGDLSAQMNAKNNNEKYIRELRENLKFSAYFFDAYLQSNLESELDNYVLILGSASYYLCDLPGSSYVLINRIEKESLNLDSSNLEMLLYWLLLGDFTTHVSVIDGLYQEDIYTLCVLLSDFYQNGDGEDAIFFYNSEFRNKVYQLGTPRELLLVDIICAVVKKRIENSSWKCLPIYTGLEAAEWKEILRNNRNFIKEFWPSQHLLGTNGVFKGESAIVQLPTSAGKTKATEIIIRSAFLSKRVSIAVIVAPFKALCHEISESLTNTFLDENISIDEMSDILQIDFEIESILNSENILVATPEKLIYILRHFPEIAEKIGLLIYDEGHQFDSGTRGINYELLLTSLNSMVPSNVQKVLISAVVSNANILSSWLNGDVDNKVVAGINITSTYRTVALASWLDRLGRLEFVNEQNPELNEFYVPRIIEQQTLQLKGREKNVRLFPEKGDSNTISIFLGLKLSQNGSVAIFCGKKNSVSSLCEKIVDAYDRGLTLDKPVAFSNKEEIKKLHFLYKCHLGEEQAVTKNAEFGILTHHGNTPYGIRLAVEHSMKNGLANFVICTSTLSQGVNLPIKYLIVNSLYQGSERIKVRDFQNLIGRVGRSGMHTEGSIIFADTNVYDKKSNRRENWRWKQVKEMLNPINSEPVGSSLLNIFDPLYSDDKKKHYKVDYLKFFELYFNDPDRIFAGLDTMAKMYSKEGFTNDGLTRQVLSKLEIISAIESFLMANWEDINSNQSELDTLKLAKETFAYSIASDRLKEQILGLFQLISHNISKNIPENNQMKIFGKMLYGVNTAKKIEVWTRSNKEVLESCGTIEELLMVIWPLLSQNINNNIFNKCDNSEVLSEVALGWISGISFRELHNILKQKDVKIKTKKQRREIKIDNVVEICETALSFEGMLLIGAVIEIIGSMEGMSNDKIIENLKILQKRVKYGLPNRFSILVFESGLSDRIISLKLNSLLMDKGIIKNKKSFKKILKTNEQEVREELEKYPSYFTFVLDKLLK